MIKLIATDVDGALLDSEKRMPADFVPWVKAHPQIKTVIASGRQYATLCHDFEAISSDVTFICENGALVYERGKILYKNVMAKDAVLECLSVLDKIPEAVPILCATDKAYIKRTDDEEFLKNAQLYYHAREFTDGLAAAAQSAEIVKIAVFFKGCTAGIYFKELEGCTMGKDGQVVPILSGDAWIDYADTSANKGAAIKAVQQSYGIKPEECMAFGDYLNDRELLESVGESYAMANALKEIKCIARHETASNDEDGVMRVLRKLP